MMLFQGMKMQVHFLLKPYRGHMISEYRLMLIIFRCVFLGIFMKHMLIFIKKFLVNRGFFSKKSIIYKNVVPVTSKFSVVGIVMIIWRCILMYRLISVPHYIIYIIFMHNIPRWVKNIDWKKLVYLDAACTYLRNDHFIAHASDYYTDFSSCAGDRESSYLWSLLSEQISHVRNDILGFIWANTSDYIIFTWSTTDSINTLAHWIIHSIDTVIVSNLEHNSNYLPWYHVVAQTHKNLIVLPYEDIVDTSKLLIVLQKIKPPFLLSFTHASNILGWVFDIKSIAKIVHQFWWYIFVDDAQYVAHYSENVIENQIDFLAFSWHKLGWPSGIGVLYISKMASHLITSSIHLGWWTVRKIIHWVPEYKQFPEFLEWWVQNFSGILWLWSVITDIWTQDSYTRVRYVQDLTDFFYKRFHESYYSDHMDIISFRQWSIITICPKTFHAIDFHQFCNFFYEKYIISFRTGTFCADNYVNQYLHSDTNIMRFSFGVYNTHEDIDILFSAFKEYIWLLKI